MSKQEFMQAVHQLGREVRHQWIYELILPAFALAAAFGLWRWLFG
ncbi:MAG TPA: hypothetical protein VGR73_04680 [Bryobacteraceae bacterium]|nr:hypothetical protein [Bryobacteraceae bacterium]